MARTRNRNVESIIDRGAARLDKLPELVLAERVERLAATTARWRVNRVNNTWVLIGENDHVHFEDTSLGTVAYLLGMYADPNGKPDTVIRRYYSDLFEGNDLFES
ncbi:MAG: hypothetical protein JO138_18795 [Acidobacteriaceae bacterium]|nr:hypothetical protein [Acidobacteriaceae bacterium]